MKNKKINKILVITFVVMSAVLLSGCTKENATNDNSFTAAEIVTGVADLKIKANADKDLAVAKAQELFREAFYNGEDLSAGPCLSNEVLEDWVADIAHNPRQEVDNDPANQCTAYINGTAKHFVELDTAGNLIKAQ